MPRAVGRLAAAALLIALSACGGGGSKAAAPKESDSSRTSASSSASPTPVTTAQLDSIAVLGHSGATGFMSDPSDPTRDANENSWATGDNPAVRSIYVRLARTHPAMKGHSYNVAVDGSAVDNLEPQLQTLLGMANPLPDVVIVQSIDNDIQCDGSDVRHIGPYGEALGRALSRIQQEIPGAQLFLVSQWASVENWTAYAARHESAVADNSGTGPCDVFTDAGKIRPAGVRSLQHIVDGYWAEVEKVCAALPDCFTDGGAMQKMTLRDQDLAPDGNHLSIQGHAKMAALAWTAFPEQIKNRD